MIWASVQVVTLVGKCLNVLSHLSGQPLQFYYLHTHMCVHIIFNLFSHIRGSMVFFVFLILVYLFNIMASTSVHFLTNVLISFFSLTE